MNFLASRQLSHLYHKKDIAALESVSRNSTLLAIIFAAPFMLMYVFFGEWILTTFFGEKFVASYPILLILVAAQFINAVFGIVGVLLNMTHFERSTLWGVFWGAVVNVILSVILVPTYGGVGAALAVVISTVTWNLLLYRMTLVKLGIQLLPYFPRLIKQASKVVEKP